VTRARESAPSTSVLRYLMGNADLVVPGRRSSTTYPLRLRGESTVVFWGQRLGNVFRPTISMAVSKATDRTCSAWALESSSRPQTSAGRRTWKGNTRAVFEVTGTTVITPRPSRSAVRFAPTLLTTTAGRRLFASALRAGSKSTMQISPRRTLTPTRRRRWTPRAPRRLRPTRPTLPHRQGRVQKLGVAGRPCAEPPNATGFSVWRRRRRETVNLSPALAGSHRSRVRASGEISISERIERRNGAVGSAVPRKRVAYIGWKVSDYSGFQPQEGWRKPCRQRSRPSFLSPGQSRR